LGKLFSLVKPRLGDLYHTLLTPQVVEMVFEDLEAVYTDPVVLNQDLTVINITKEAVVARQAMVVKQLPPIAGEQHSTFTPFQIPVPAWWAAELIPLD
jgi:ribonuclease Z